MGVFNLLYSIIRSFNHRLWALPAAGLSAHTEQGISHGPVSAAIPNAVSLNITIMNDLYKQKSPEYDLRAYSS